MKANYLTSAYFILLMATVFTTCKKDDDPFGQYPWLENLKKTITNCTCEKSIIQAMYQKETVFYVAMTDELCDGVQNYVLLDKDGKTIRTFSSTELSAFSEAVTERKVIYRCKDKSK